MIAIEFHPAAAEEVEAAEAWYGERNPLAADAFRAELSRAIESVRNGPERWPRHLSGTRRHHFRWFPFSLIYRIETARILVVAVAHHRRKPGYWRERSAPT
ncbi:type II toxin-antitoxin system RelE/ParE family toxin [Nevskia sp.]|uniref:type II toxin-antitoxin system RelE/ParE family toxin n=1 Tax=Nevskia sp. TaxID=1929292 RepID=UPI0025D3CD43|nr:type II toxin-antitoxin system RelE/ParE family toxin [Nevskia sp.]